MRDIDDTKQPLLEHLIELRRRLPERQWPG